MDENTRFLINRIDAKFDHLDQRMNVMFTALRNEIKKDYSDLKKELDQINAWKLKIIGGSTAVSAIVGFLSAYLFSN